MSRNTLLLMFFELTNIGLAPALAAKYFWIELACSAPRARSGRIAITIDPGTRQGRICHTRLLPKEVFATNTRSSFRYSSHCTQSTCFSRGSNGYSNLTALVMSSRCSEPFATAILDCISRSLGWTVTGGVAGVFAATRNFFQAIGLLLERYKHVSIFDTISGGSGW